MHYLWIALAVAFLLAMFYTISVHNEFVALKNQISEAFSTMDVYLTERHGLIPNLVATVKGYAAHESQTLENIVNARNKAVSASSPTEKLSAEGDLSNAISRLFALAESYPDLKANTNFLSLQADLKEMENNVATSRRYYNGVVRRYNTMLETIPSRFVAALMRLERAPLFEVSDASVRENVKVEF